MTRLKLGLIVVLAFCAACLGGIVGSATVNGTYTLRTVNASTLPYATTTGGVTTEIIDDAVTLYAGSTYSELGHSRTTANGQVTNNTNTETGNYTLLGNSVTLHSSSAIRERIAVVEANTMTIAEGNLTSVFTKQ